MTWMTPNLIKYPQNDILPADRNESTRIKKQAEMYCISRGRLFKRSFSGPYMRCITPKQAKMKLKELHEVECGSHLSDRSLVLRTREPDTGLRWKKMPTDKLNIVINAKNMPKSPNFLPKT
ncbi:hypothetical protein N665_0015s0091 [Sinapis alba]|nr:hypothetical protein N665_0015s0091 [Sinapis alba]